MINEPFSKTARKSFVKIIWPRTYFVVTVVWIFYDLEYSISEHVFNVSSKFPCI